MRTIWILLLISVFAPLATWSEETKPPIATTKEETAPSPTAVTPEEAELGAKVSEQIEKHYKLVDDPETVKKLNALAAAITPYTERPDVTYKCKVLDIRELNAMSIPGGTIYFTKGLLEAVESDHELAGVMAHEMAHNALYHWKRTLERETKISWVQITTILVAVMANKETDAPTGELITMSELVKQALMNGYTVDLEYEADRHAVEYLHKEGHYDPVGLYSVIVGFEQMEKRYASAQLVYDTYLKTHPRPTERMAAMKKQFADLGVSINLWRVLNFRASVLEPETTDEGYVVKLGNTDIITLTQATDGTDAKARANEYADAINRQLMKDYVHQFDVDIDLYDGNAYVRIRRIPVLTLTADDAKASDMTLEALGQLAVYNLKSALWRERVKRA